MANTEGLPGTRGSGGLVTGVTLSLFGLLFKKNGTDRVAYKHRNLFLTVLEAGSPRSRHGHILGRALFLDHFHASSHDRRVRELSGAT